MEFNINTLMPAIGIVTGWFLNEISQFIKGKQVDRKLINKSLHSLISLQLIIEQKKSILSSATNAKNISKHHLEALEHLLDDKQLKSEEFINAIKVAIKSISEIDPILSHELEVFSNSTTLFDKSNFNNKEMKKNHIAIEEKFSLASVFSTQIDHYIKKLTKKHSLLMQIKYYLYKRKNYKSESATWDALFEI